MRLDRYFYVVLTCQKKNFSSIFFFSPSYLIQFKRKRKKIEFVFGIIILVIFYFIFIFLSNNFFSF